MTYIPDVAGVTTSTKNSVNARDSGQGSLSVAITDIAATTMTVNSEEGLNYVQGQYVKIDSEIILINSIADDTLTISRGQLGSSAATHSVSANVRGIGVAGNTTLNGTINDSTTTVNVTSASAMETGETVKIDSEFMIITAISTNQLTVLRGQFNSTAASHSDGATVKGVFIGVRDRNTQPWVQTSLISNQTGTLFYDFSNDGTNYSTYPVTGFTVSVTGGGVGIHEFHQAVKGKRFFRVRFENGGSSATTVFNVYTYFGIFSNGMLPLNQSIGSDQDSTVVRSVGVGSRPDGTFANTLQDGSAYKTTDNLSATKIAVGQSLTNTSLGAQAIFDDVSGFGDSGFVYIDSEYIEYTSKDTATLTLTFQLNLTNSGSGYTNGTYTDVATTTSGAGKSLTLDIVIADNVISSFTINTRGSGYVVTDTITPDSATLGGGSSGQFTVVRGAFGSTAAAHAAEAVVGEVYDSGILTLDGYTQVATKMNCSTTAQTRFEWYTDSYGSDSIRTLSLTYPPAGGVVGDYDYLAAPAFGTYTRYIIANTDSAGNPTTDLYFETEFYTKSISAQILTVNSTIIGAMTTNLTRSVIVGKQPDGDYVNLPADGSGFSSTSNLLASTTLNNGSVLSAGATSMTVASDPGYSVGDYVRIEDEYIKITVVSATPAFTIERGQLGSSDVEHADSTAVYYTYVSDAPGGVTGDFVDTDGYNTISLFISSDTVSLTNGIIFQFTDDAQATPPTVRGTRVYSYSSNSVSDGQRVLAETTTLDGVRVLYTNGTEATTDFIIEMTLKTNAADTTTRLNEVLQGDTDVIDVRSVIAGVKKNGLYSNVPIDSDGYIKIHLQRPRTAADQVSSAEETIQISESFPYNINPRRIQTYSLTTNVTGTVYINPIPEVTTGGSGYTDGNTESTTGGEGTGLTVKIWVTEGAITDAEVVDPGNGAYVDGDIVTVATGGTDGTLTLSVGSGTDLTVGYETDGGGVITSIFPDGTGRGSAWAIYDLVKIGGGNSDGYGRIESIDGTEAAGAVLAISVFQGGTGYTDGTASFGVGQSLMKLQTNAGTYNKAMSRTISTVKYQPGSGVVSRLSGVFATPATGSNQYSGFGDGNDGVFVGYQGTTFGILRRTDGAETFTAQGNFNIDTLNGVGGSGNPSNLNIDFQTGNVFQIKFFSGFGGVLISIKDPSDSEFEPFHTIAFGNTSTTPIFYSSTFPVQYEIENTTNTTALTLSTSECMGAIEGKKTYSTVPFSVGLVNTDIANGALIIKNRPYYQGRINKTDVMFRQFTLANTNASNNARTKTFTFTVDGTFSTDPTYNDVDDDASVVVYHNVANTSVTVTGGNVINKVGVPGADSIVITFRPGELVLRPTQTLHIISDGTTYTYDIDTVWIEDQ